MTAPAAAPPRIAGLLLAAGMGRRFGGPKALADTGDGPWVLRALETLSGLDPLLVVVGAAAEEVTALLPPPVRAVPNPDYSSGMGSSLAAGLRALAEEPVDAAVIMLVDLPDVPAEAIARVVQAVAIDRLPDASYPPTALGGHATAEGVVINRQALARAAYGGVPGHPVLIGAAHFPGVLAAASGDRGARDYLATHTTMLVECGDLAGGMDVDTAP